MSTETEPSKHLSPDDRRRYLDNIKDEVDGAFLYRALAEAEDDPYMVEVYNRLAETEERHGRLWEDRLREAGQEVPTFSPSRRARLLAWVARRFGADAVTPLITRLEANAYTTYDNQPEAVAHGLDREERSHARLFRQLTNIGRGDVPIARIEGRHRGASGNAIRAAVLGANDGLVSNLSLVMGMAGASPGADVVLLTGVAGLLAGALSMGLGEWISVQNSAEYYRNQLQIERDELETMPDEELEELVLIYQSKGFSEVEARQLANNIFEDHERALETLAREELGVGEEGGGNPWTAAIVSFLTFSSGAVLPVIPWLFSEGLLAVVLSLVFSGLGLAFTGAAITFFTGRGLLFSAARMMVFGLAASAITFAIGSAIGVSAA